MAQCRKRRRSGCVAAQFSSLVLVHRKSRQLQRHLRFTRRGRGHDDVDMDISIVILLGGELNAEIEHQTARDSTMGSDKPLGRRGAVMANTVGACRS